MRQPQHNQHGRKPRGRNRKTHNPLSRVYDSNGPDTKIRGTATHIAEKYQSLARDAFSAGERIVAENYLQHAEHYLRIVATAQASIQPQEQNSQGDQSQQGRNDNRNGGGAEASGDGDNRSSEEGSSDQNQHSGNQPGSQQGRNRRGNRRRTYNADGEGSRNQASAEAGATSDTRNNEARGNETRSDEAAEQSPVAASVSPIDTPAAAQPEAAHAPANDGEESSSNGAAVRKPRTRRAKAEPDGDAPLAPKRRTRRKPKSDDQAPEVSSSAEVSSSTEAGDAPAEQKARTADAV